MKKKVLFLTTVAALVALAGCSKEKTCRCSVLGSSTVRVIKIESGNCEDIKEFHYHDNLDSLLVDSLLCTGHEFAIDSVYHK